MNSGEVEDIHIVGVGSSAGGIEALKGFLSSISINTNISYVIVQHLNPQYKSMLTEILGRESSLDVIEISQKLKIEPNKIYVTPANSNVSIKGNHFLLVEPEQVVGPKPSVDLFFISLADQKGEKAIGVILSGTGADGSVGLKAIKANSGLTIAQDPKSAKYDGMPLSAIDLGVVDKKMLPDEMGPFIENYVKSGHLIEKDYEDIGDKQIEELFTILNDAFDIDFTHYKTATITRRLDRRMSSVSCRTLKDYLEHIKKNSEELTLLYNDILIGVTSFYRDCEAFEALSNSFRGYIQNLKGNELRIWSAGCATGEEAYTIAMIASDIAESTNKQIDIQVFATDMDENSLSAARSGIYPEIISTSVPKRLLERYFKRKGSYYEVSRKLRERVIISKHNILRDPPFLRIDLVCCRNLLIYFDTSIQQKTLLNFHHSLKPGGYMFLGKSETLGKASIYFTTLSSKYKIYKSRVDIKPQLLDIMLPANKKRTKNSLTKEQSAEITFETTIKDTIFYELINRCVIVDENGNLIYVKGNLDGIASLPKGSINLNFTKMLHSDLSVDFRSLLFKVVKSRLHQKSRGKVIKHGDSQKLVTISIYPISEPQNSFLTIFYDEPVKVSTKNYTTSDEDRGKLEALQDELDSTKEHLQTVVEELETSNEELQATNEELQSSNEELQATNEELETSNEELQSSNEELQTAYIELKMVYEEQEKQRTILEETNKELIRLNSELNTKEKYISALLDAEQAIVLVTQNGEDILDANQGFFNFFSEYNSLEEFRFKHKSICDLFEDVGDDKSFIGKKGVMANGGDWIEEMMKNSKKHYKALILKEKKPYTFSIHINQLDVVSNKYVLVLSNITDVETEKMIKEKEISYHVDKLAQEERVIIQRSTIFSAGDFLQTITNAWRRPLNKIISTIRELVEDSSYEPIDTKKLSEFEKISVEELSNLVSSIDMTKEFFVISKNREYFDLVEIIELIKNIYSLSQNSDGIGFNNILLPQKAEIYGYRDEARYLFQNLFGLFGNYILTSKESKIDLEIKEDDEDIIINISSPDENLELQKFLTSAFVEDNKESGNSKDFVKIRMKVIRSIVELEYGGKIEIKSSGIKTKLKIVLKAR